MTKRQTSVTTALALIAIALGFMASRQIFFRADITRDRLNTVSPVSRALHAEIRDTVQITYFISDRLRAVSPIPGEIEDFLREYVGFSRGRMRLAVRDPARANMAGEVERLGMVPHQIQTLDRDQASIATVFSGILIEYVGEVSVLPTVFSLETLEYDLTSRIRAMARGTPRVAGILLGGSDLNPRLLDEGFRHLRGALIQAGFQARVIAPGGEIPEALSALIVLDGPETLGEAALYMIDRHVSGGGRALFATRAVGVDTAGGTLGAWALRDEGLLAMLASYGAILHPEIVMERSALARPGLGFAFQTGIFRNPQWIAALPENANPLHPVTARFAGLDMYWASPITLAPPEGVSAEPLVMTTPGAFAMREPFFTDPGAGAMLERDIGLTSLGPRVLAASLSGYFPSWFEGRPAPEGAGPMPPRPAPRPGRVIVVGDSDFAGSLNVTVTGAMHNFGFVIQAADWLGHDDDIIGIRARTSGTGRLDRIADDEARRAAMGFARAVNVFAVPILVILAGAFFPLRRRAMARAAAERAGGAPGGEGGGAGSGGAAGAGAGAGAGAKE